MAYKENPIYHVILKMEIYNLDLFNFDEHATNSRGEANPSLPKIIKENKAVSMYANV